MVRKAIFIISGAALFALTGTVSAGPVSITSRTVVSPPQIQPEPVHYRGRYNRHYSRYYGGYRRYYYSGYPRYGYGYDPGAAVAGAALGLMTLPFAAAATGWPYYGYYGDPYYGGYPYYW